MPKDFDLELRCKENDDGSYNGGIWYDGKQVADTDYIVQNGDCEDMQELWRRARDRYGKNPQVVGDCVDCFPASFFEAEALHPG